MAEFGKVSSFVCSKEFSSQLFGVPGRLISEAQCSGCMQKEGCSQHSIVAEQSEVFALILTQCFQVEDCRELAYGCSVCLHNQIDF